MSLLTDPEIAKLQQDGAVRMAWLVDLDFKTGASRVWEGAGILETNDGNLWSGLGELAKISGLKYSGIEANQARFELSGVDPKILLATVDSASEIKGRIVRVFGQVFSLDGEPYATPFPLWTGVMDTLEYSASGPSTRSVTLTAENLFVRRARPSFATISDRDQKGRFADDRGSEFAGLLANKTTKWPDY